VLTLKDPKGKPLGSAIYNPKSQIVARRFSFRAQDLDQDFFTRRIARAFLHREQLGIDTQLCRVVWSESDGLPGLIVDRYGDHVVIQTLTLAMDLRTDLIVTALCEVLNPKSITARNEARVRLAEGMELEKKTLFGEPPAPFMIESNGLAFHIDVIEGQKTGLYLDQLSNVTSASASSPKAAACSTASATKAASPRPVRLAVQPKSPHWMSASPRWSRPNATPKSPAPPSTPSLRTPSTG